MPGIVKGDTSSCSNPLLPFFYQAEGKLADVYSVRWEVYKSGGASVLDSGTLNMDACADGGDKVDTGYYVAPVDSSARDYGAHDIVFYYVVEDGDAEQAMTYKFEVLYPAVTRISRQYMGYLPSDDAQLDDYDLVDRQKAIFKASRDVERLTGRFFFPRHMVLKHTVRPESSRVHLMEPVIGISGITVESAGVVVDTISSTDVDLGNVRVFNRHLEYLLSPDDRMNPKIEFARIGVGAELVEFSTFPMGTKNVHITGVFGYTDPDGGPMGETPRPLLEVISALSYRQLVDPLGEDPFLSNPERVKSARTRDQQITFFEGASSSGGGSGGEQWTGDERLDSILGGYARPRHVGVAG
jgi:hypothetical protein